MAKTESQSSEALRTTQAESARATRAEAVRSAQTEALVDSLLSFQQTQAAELTKRDDAIAELQRSVAKLHIQQQGGSERQLGSADGQSQTTEGQQDGLERQKFTLEGQRFACTAQQDAMLGHSHAGTNPLGCQKAAAGAAKGSCGRNEKAAVGLLKGRTRQSIDGRISRQGPKVAIKTKATASRATSCLPQGGLSTPQRGLSTQTDLQQRRAFSELLENEVCFILVICCERTCLGLGLELVLWISSSRVCCCTLEVR